MSRAEAAEPAALLELAVDAARLGGALLLERFERGDERAIGSKSTPTDLVSEADLASQRAIRELLARARPQDAFLGEEQEGDGPAEAPTGDASRGAATGLRWVVDPLDGTVNFLFGIPQWSVSVAVQDASATTIAGAVFDPCRGELFTAARGARASLNGRAIESSAREDLASAMVATGFYYDAGVRVRQAEVLGGLIGRVRDIRRLGSAALDLAWTAAGRYDAYFERGTKLWDVAAGALVCELAGLEVAELPASGDGGAGTSPGLPPGILVAPAALRSQLMELVG
ncbi:MAG: inositol monophosphatase [Acidobacteriota bacterium]|nr:inositol monophosphatase [Acidobacteriota bacterium]